MSDYRSNAGNAVQSFMTGALIGGAIGAAVALLYAPKKGKKLRDDISETIGDLSSRLSGLLKNAKESGEDLIHDGIEAGDELVHEAYKRAESLINEADRIIHDARSRVTGG
jgi:gas vesicle protein